MKSHTHIANQIKWHRHTLDLSQSELAKRVGCASMEISHWESGRRTPSVINLIKLAEALYRTLDELVS